MIVVENLVRRFGDRTVLDGISLTVEPGERVVLRGPNGSGKTTLLRCILGTLTADDGTVTVAGHPAGTIGARRLVGCSLAQDRSFYLRLTGRENLLLFARLRGLRARTAAGAVDAVVEELALRDIAAVRADRCSTGQLQQLALARALVGDPRALLLDEPTRSLDDAARTRLWQAILRRPHLATVMATHLEEDVAQGSRVVVLAADEAGLT